MTRLLFCILFASLLSSSTAFGQQKIALVVGVERYQKSGFRDLEYAEDDANEFKAELERHGFTVDAVIGDRATLENVQTTLKSFYAKSKKLSKADIVIVYFSGHGTQKAITRKDSNGNPIQAEEPFFCPTDAIKSDVGTLVALNDVIVRLEEDSGSDTNLILLDACRDSSDKGGKGGIDGSTIRTLNDKLAMFFAAKSGQRSFEAAQLKHGIFTHFLLEGLRGKAADEDNDITLQGLTSYVSKRVERDSPKLLDVPSNEAQRPNLMGNLSGTVVLGKLAKRDVAMPVRNESQITNGLGMKLILIPSGEFLMGSTQKEIDDYAKSDSTYKKTHSEAEEPQHRVTISRPFYLGSTEVTRGQFAEFVSSRNYKTEAEIDRAGGFGIDKTGGISQRTEYNWRNTGTSQSDTHPVVNVSWNDAVAFCEWLSTREGRKYQLPTEAQWEYACRDGTKTSTPFCFGNQPETLASYGNVADGTAKATYAMWNAIKAKDGFVFTSPVGNFRASHFGLWDMHGNVWEWCSDYYDNYQEQASTDPTGPTVGIKRVYRGGSWGEAGGYCRSAFRVGRTPDFRGTGVGFRVSLVTADK